jgi:hypothetical protein
MVKLKELVSGMAWALGDPEPSVNVLAIQLRKSGLIKSTGRGLNAAEMRPADAAALLVSCLGGGLAIETGRTTAAILAAKPVKGEASISRNNAELADLFSKDMNFGDVVATIISLYMEGEIQDYMIKISVTRNRFSLYCEVEFNEVGEDLNSLEAVWHQKYYPLEHKEIDNIFKGFGAAENLRKNYYTSNEFRSGMDVAGILYKTTTVSVGSMTISNIAECLRDGFDNGDANAEEPPDP